MSLENNLPLSLVRSVSKYNKLPSLCSLRWRQSGGCCDELHTSKTLKEAWDDLDSCQKLSIAGQLRYYIERLRALNGNYIGPINRGKAIIRQSA